MNRMHVASHEPAVQCPNCDASLTLQPAPAYCPRCGQETVLHPPTLFEFVHEFIGHYIALEGALWRTLRLLITRPGRLTSEYLAGRRKRYVMPLRLYLTISFVFFLIVKGFGASSIVTLEIVTAVDSRGHPITAKSDPAQYPEALRQMRACIDVPGSCTWYDTLGARIGLKATAQAERPDALVERFVGMAPYAVFVLLPLFAALVMLAYRRRRTNYGAHFVFSLHMHSFWYLLVLVLAPLPGSAALIGLLLVPIGYAVWALHTVYRGRWSVTLLRSASIAICYIVALLVTISGLSIVSVVNG
jgi:hypothetical protein